MPATSSAWNMLPLLFFFPFPTLVTQSCPTLCDPLNYSPPGSCPWDFPGKNARVGCPFLIQGIFLTQGSNPHLLCLLHCRWILYSLSHQGTVAGIQKMTHDENSLVSLAIFMYLRYYYNV